MSQIPKEEIIISLKPHLKYCGFHKKGATWRKISSDVIFVFNIQESKRSQVYYIKLGIYVRAIGSKLEPSENLCHIQTIVEHNNRTIFAILEEAMKWFDAHGSMKELKKLYLQNRLPIMTFIQLKQFLDELDI